MNSRPTPLGGAGRRIPTATRPYVTSVLVATPYAGPKLGDDRHKVTLISEPMLGYNKSSIEQHSANICQAVSKAIEPAGKSANAWCEPGAAPALGFIGRLVGRDADSRPAHSGGSLPSARAVLVLGCSDTALDALRDIVNSETSTLDTYGMGKWPCNMRWKVTLGDEDLFPTEKALSVGGWDIHSWDNKAVTELVEHILGQKGCVTGVERCFNYHIQLPTLDRYKVVVGPGTILPEGIKRMGRTVRHTIPIRGGGQVEVNMARFDERTHAQQKAAFERRREAEREAERAWEEGEGEQETEEEGMMEEGGATEPQEGEREEGETVEGEGEIVEGEREEGEIVEDTQQGEQASAKGQGPQPVEPQGPLAAASAVSQGTEPAAQGRGGLQKPATAGQPKPAKVELSFEGRLSHSVNSSAYTQVPLPVRVRVREDALAQWAKDSGNCVSKAAREELGKVIMRQVITRLGDSLPPPPSGSGPADGNGQGTGGEGLKGRERDPRTAEDHSEAPSPALKKPDGKGLGRPGSSKGGAAGGLSYADVARAE